MATKVYCDKCKEEINMQIKDGTDYYNGVGFAYHPTRTSPIRVEIDYDLCDRCFGICMEFMTAPYKNNGGL